MLKKQKVMKKVLMVVSMAGLLLATTTLFAQEKKEDKSKRPSPPAKVNQTIASGAVISIDYSQPSVKGRTIGKDLEPKGDAVWRTGANEATVFETSKAVKVNGQALPAGKYGLFSIAGNPQWTIVFNKTWNQWGAFEYDKAMDVLHIMAKAEVEKDLTEQFTIEIDKKGEEQIVVFEVTPSKEYNDNVIKSIVTIDGKTFDKTQIDINYPHIYKQIVLKPAEAKVLNASKKLFELNYLSIPFNKNMQNKAAEIKNADNICAWLYTEQIIIEIFDRIKSLHSEDVSRNMKYKAVMDFFKHLKALGFTSFYKTTT